jgi:MFS superfamily sulfate permease-like transporter
VDFLSRSTITGFMGGTATIIILQQLKGMLGMKHFTPKTDLVSVMRSIFYYRHEVSVMSCHGLRQSHSTFLFSSAPSFLVYE